jgi:hypothetical protein
MWLERISGRASFYIYGPPDFRDRNKPHGWVFPCLYPNPEQRMGLELAQDLGLTMIGRVKKSRFGLQRFGKSHF